MQNQHTRELISVCGLISVCLSILLSSVRKNQAAEPDGAMEICHEFVKKNLVGRLARGALSWCIISSFLVYNIVLGV